VDDETVDRYGDALRAMNSSIQRELGGRERIVFRGLVDLFDVGAEDATILDEKLDLKPINHFIKTTSTTEAELCRKILMAGCESEREGVRSRIEGNDHAIISLYRGFSKFMLEDLSLHPATASLSKSQRRKLSSKVAFEMIMVSAKGHEE
jgi:pyoverdine/dityrosine biosynthesis protein Dit1